MLAEASQTKAQELVENDLFNQAKIRAEEWTDTARGRWGEWDRPFKVWFCLSCKSKFRSEDASKSAMCQKCNYVFPDRRTYAKHWREEQQDLSKAVTCQKCSEVFPIFITYNRHYNEKHRKK